MAFTELYFSFAVNGFFLQWNGTTNNILSSFANFTHSWKCTWHMCTNVTLSGAVILTIMSDPVLWYRQMKRMWCQYWLVFWWQSLLTITASVWANIDNALSLQSLQWYSNQNYKKHACIDVIFCLPYRHLYFFISFSFSLLVAENGPWYVNNSAASNLSTR